MILLSLKKKMKAKITAISNNELTLLCPANSFTAGQEVTIEDTTKGSNNQNRFFHELVKIWVSSGCSSYTGGVLEVREFVKRDIGEGFDAYFYTADDLQAVKVKRFEDIPEHIQKDKRRIMGKLKSWGAYTKKQRMNCIQKLIDNMIESGVNSKEFESILMEFNNG